MDRTEFLARRRSGIGGSDIGAICGVSPWRSPLDVYYDKIEELPASENNTPFPTGENKALYWGAVHEAAIAEAYTVVTGRKLMRYNRLLVHSKYAWLIGDVDRLAWCADGTRPFNAKTGEVHTDTGIEIKTARFKSEEWGDEGSDNIPLSYFFQVQWYMENLPTVQRFEIPALFGGSDLQIFIVHRDDALIAKLIEIGDDFWNNHVLAHVPPPPRSYEEVKRLHPEAAVERMTASAELEADIRELARIIALRKSAEAAEAEQKLKVAEQMASAELAEMPDGTPLATFKTTKKGRVLTVKVK